MKNLDDLVYEIEKNKALHIGGVIKRFLTELINNILNYFGYLIIQVNEGSTIISGNYVSWKNTTKIIKKNSCIYVTNKGKIRTKKLTDEVAIIGNVL